LHIGQPEIAARRAIPAAMPSDAPEKKCRAASRRRAPQRGPATARGKLSEAHDALARLPGAPQAGGERDQETHAATRSNGEIEQRRSNSEQRAEARSGEIG
jgi:hypothetical protein